MGIRGADVTLLAMAGVTAVLVLTAVSKESEPVAAAGTVVRPPVITSTTTAAPRPATLAQVRAVLTSSKPVTVQVLGDSTGNDPNEWVDLWAKHLGDTRQVTLHQWDRDAQAWNPTPVKYGQDGPAVTIWNGSQPGARASYPVDHFGVIVPAQADLVVYSFGHNNTADNVISELARTMDVVEAKWGHQPTVVVLQNPGQGDHQPVQDATLATLKEWAGGLGYPTVDVTTAFRQAPDMPSLMKDTAHPNYQGEQLWEQVVQDALG